MTFIHIQDATDFEIVDALDFLLEACRATLDAFDDGHANGARIGKSIHKSLSALAGQAALTVDRDLAHAACAALGRTVALGIVLGDRNDDALNDRQLGETVYDLLATIDGFRQIGANPRAVQRTLNDVARFSRKEVARSAHVGDLLRAAAGAVAFAVGPRHESR